jgi:hypothetical protein
MMLRNTRESWGGVAKTLHWSAAAVVFVMLGLGLTMVHGDLGAGAKFEAYQLHKSTGFLVLAVMLARGLWRIANPPPAPLAGTRPWEPLHGYSGETVRCHFRPITEVQYPRQPRPLQFGSSSLTILFPPANESTGLLSKHSRVDQRRDN